MSKIHYFSNKFSKIAKRCGLVVTRSYMISPNFCFFKQNRN